MSSTELQNELQSVQSAANTGKLQILGNLNGSSTSATIDIYAGQVVKLRVAKESGLAAAKLLAALLVNNYVFLESSRISASPEADTPDMETLLNMLAGTHEAVSSSSGIASENIVHSASEAMRKVMGKGTEKVIKELAETFPPDENEALFIKKCIESAANMVGENQAQKIFAPLLENL